MIKHGGFIDFYVDRQFANYFTQLLPYLALKLNFFTFEQMQYIWGLSFIGIPISILLISLKNFSKSYRDLNLFLMVVILFFMPQFGRWVSEAIICLSLTVYIFSVLNKEAISKIEVVLMTLFSLILIKSYSTTAFTNLFLIYLVFIHKNLKLISKITITTLLTLGVVAGWKSILYPFFPITSEEVRLGVLNLFLYNISQIQFNILGALIILLGLVLKSQKVLILSLLPFMIQLYPPLWNSFLGLTDYRFLLSFPLLVLLILLWLLKDNHLNNKKLSIILLIGFFTAIPSVMWKTWNWERLISNYEEFYKNSTGKININKTMLGPNREESPLGWETVNYQLLFPKNNDLILFYEGPKHEDWIQSDFLNAEKALIQRGWR